LFALQEIVKTGRQERNDELLAKWLPELNKQKETTKPLPKLEKNLVFMNRIHQQLMLNWNPPNRDIAKLARVTVWVDGNGRISAMHISRSSGDQQADEQATLAVRRTKFPKLPGVFGADGAPVELAFAYHPHPGIFPNALVRIRSGQPSNKQ
jgi:TonB family protein